MAQESLHELAQQLDRLPGGPQAAIPDFFSLQLSGDPASSPAAGHIESWPLKAGGQLTLHADLAAQSALLTHAGPTAEATRIADFPMEIAEIARAHGASPIVLALIAIASGQTDDGRRLKACLPKVDGAARDLMLMTVCRLCG